MLPPQALDAGEMSLVLDRLPQLLADHAGLRGCRLAIANGSQAEEIGRELRTVGVDDESSSHPEDAAEEPGLEDDVVPGGGLSGIGGWVRGRVDGGPIVLSEQESGEVDFMRELDEALQRRRPGIERGRPGIDVRDILEAPRQRLHQFRLLSGRAEKNARLVQPLLHSRAGQSARNSLGVTPTNLRNARARRSAAIARWGSTVSGGHPGIGSAGLA